MEKQFEEPNEKNFAQELVILLNKKSKDNESNTPDYILAEFLIGCLNAFNVANAARDAHQLGIINE